MHRPNAALPLLKNSLTRRRTTSGSCLAGGRIPQFRHERSQGLFQSGLGALTVSPRKADIPDQSSLSPLLFFQPQYCHIRVLFRPAKTPDDLNAIAGSVPPKAYGLDNIMTIGKLGGKLRILHAQQSITRP